jgi:uncharacterized protein (TIGR03435 family)
LIGLPAGPAWAYSLPYTIDAKAVDGSNATRAESPQMIQTLLADRFKLRFHREKKDVSGFVLVVDKDGPRLKAPDDSTERRGSVSGPGSLKV